MKTKLIVPGKKGQAFDMDIIFNPMFLILLVVGFLVFGIQLTIWKKMDFQMAWYVYMGVPVAIPIAAYIFAVMKS